MLPNLIEELAAERLSLGSGRTRCDSCGHVHSVYRATNISPLLQTIAGVPSELIVCHFRKERYQLRRMAQIVLTGRRPHKETRQHGLANVRRIELTSQSWIEQPRANGYAYGRFEIANNLLGRGRITGANSTN